MSNPANGHRADFNVTDEARHMPRKANLQALLALALSAGLAPPIEENTPHHPHHTPVKPPRQPKPLPQFEPAPVWKDAPQEQAEKAERVVQETAIMAEQSGHLLLAANDIALAQDPSGALWFVDMRPDTKAIYADSLQDVRHILGRLAPAKDFRVRARLAPHITTRQRRTVARWIKSQERVAKVLRGVGVSAQRFEMGGGLPGFEVERAGSLRLVLGKQGYEYAAKLPRYMVRFYAKTPAQFVGFDEDFDGITIFRSCDEADADVWSDHERFDLEGLVGRSYDEKILDIIPMTREVDHARA